MKSTIQTSPHRMFRFAGGDDGDWLVTEMLTIRGEPLPTVKRVNIVAGSETSLNAHSIWILRGMSSNARYVTRSERIELIAKQPELGRPKATRGALVPMRKNAAWWAMTQDERRSILEEQSHHIKIGIRYLPAIGRAIYHCRDLSENEPFDFLAWFEYEPTHENEFNNLLAELRETEEWKYVDREFDIRLTRES